MGGVSQSGAWVKGVKVYGINMAWIQVYFDTLRTGSMSEHCD